MAGPIDISNFLKSDPDGASTLVGGSGDNVQYSSSITTRGQEMSLTVGSAASPDTSLNSLGKLNRTIALTASLVSGDGAEQACAFEAATAGTATNQVQTVGAVGVAKNAGTAKGTQGSPDACGLYGVGRVIGGGIGTAIGLFANGRADVGTASLSGAQINAYNNSGTANSVNPTGFGTKSNGIWLTAEGSRVAAGLQLGNAFGVQFDVGVHFNGQLTNAVTGPTLTADIQSDSAAGTSILIGGTHAAAAVAIKDGSGALVIGGTTPNAGDAPILDVQSTTSNSALVRIGSTAAATFGVKIANNSASTGLFISGASGQVLTGTAAGDAGIRFGSSKEFHIGRDGNRGTIRLTDNVGIGPQADSFGGGAGGCVFIANATTAPASNPSNGGVLYVAAGALKYRGSSGTVTTLGTA